MQDITVGLHAVFAFQFNGFGREDGHKAVFPPDGIEGGVKVFFAAVFLKKRGLPILERKPLGGDTHMAQPDPAQT